MQRVSKGAAALLIAMTANVNADETFDINLTTQHPLFDGRCDADEWKQATKFALPAHTAIYLMHDQDALLVCATGKAEDYPVVDVYIQDTTTGKLHNLHASAQLSESVLGEDGWGEPMRWNLKSWSGFWVPYAGQEDYEKGKRPVFLKGSDREIRVLKKKFAGNVWKMMFKVSGVYHNGEYGAVFSYPETATDTDALSWLNVRFAN